MREHAGGVVVHARSRRERIRRVLIGILLGVLAFTALVLLATSGPQGRGAGLALGALLGLAALCVLGAFHRHVVDPGRGRILSQWGVFFPWHERTQPLLGPERVTLSAEGTYQVHLHDGEAIALHAGRDPRDARRVAERLARALGVELVDRTVDPPSVRTPAELDRQ